MAKDKEALVSRTYRAAIKSGDDYITIEETISLPPTASDSEIAQAVDTGLRIFRAQQSAVEAQMAELGASTVGTASRASAMRVPVTASSSRSGNQCRVRRGPIGR